MDFTTNIDDLNTYEQSLLCKLQDLRNHIPEADAIRLNGWIRYGSPKQLHDADDELVELGRKKAMAKMAQTSSTRSRPVSGGYGPWSRHTRWDYYHARDEVYWTRRTPGGGVETTHEDPSKKADQSLLDEIRSVEIRGPRKRKGGSGRKPKPTKPVIHNF